MVPLKATIAGLRPPVALLLPMALWVLLWAGLQSGAAEDIFKSGDPVDIIHRVRSTLPLWAGYLAVVLFVVRFYKQRSGSVSFFGPLGLVTVYGLAGLAASFLSPNGSVALYWAAAYLSVPLVLWGIVWDRDGLEIVHRIIKLNWLILILAALGLFIVALLYLDLGRIILTPSLWFDCSLYRNYEGHSWFNLSSGVLRPTGLGRYAALAAILAMPGLWAGRSRLLWAVILLTALILLLTSGARGAFMGFAAAAVLIGLFYGGKKAVVWGALAIAVLVPIVWSTGVYGQFLDSCIFRSNIIGPPPLQQQSSSLGQSLSSKESAENLALWKVLPIRVKVPEGGWILEQVPSTLWPSFSATEGIRPEEGSQNAPSISNGKPLLTEDQPDSDVLTRVLVGEGLQVEQILPSREQNAPQALSRIVLPEGYWLLKPLPEIQQYGPDPPLRIKIDPGLQTLEQLAPGEALDLDRLWTEDTERKIITLSGRPSVWNEGFKLFKERPVIGHGFHADRLLLGTHMHNTLMHALVQTGLVGTIPLVIALLYGWLLLIKALPKRANLPDLHRHLLIQVMGVLVFFSFRTTTESTGAFFGVDWLVLAPILVYLQVVNLAAAKAEANAESTSPAKKSLLPWKSAVSTLRGSPSV